MSSLEHEDFVHCSTCLYVPSAQPCPEQVSENVVFFTYQFKNLAHQTISLAFGSEELDLSIPSLLHKFNSDMHSIRKIVKRKKKEKKWKSIFKLFSSYWCSASRYCCNCYLYIVNVTTMNSASISYLLEVYSMNKL